LVLIGNKVTCTFNLSAMTPELAIELIGAGPVKKFVYPAQNLKLDVEVIINNYDQDYKNQFPKSYCCTITISIARKCNVY